MKGAQWQTGSSRKKKNKIRKDDGWWWSAAGGFSLSTTCWNLAAGICCRSDRVLVRSRSDVLSHCRCSSSAQRCRTGLRSGLCADLSGSPAASWETGNDKGPELGNKPRWRWSLWAFFNLATTRRRPRNLGRRILERWTMQNCATLSEKSAQSSGSNTDCSTLSDWDGSLCRWPLPYRHHHL